MDSSSVSCADLFRGGAIHFINLVLKVVWMRFVKRRERLTERVARGAHFVHWGRAFVIALHTHHHYAAAWTGRLLNSLRFFLLSSRQFWFWKRRSYVFQKRIPGFQLAENVVILVFIGGKCSSLNTIGYKWAKLAIPFAKESTFGKKHHSSSHLTHLSPSSLGKQHNTQHRAPERDR